MFRARFVILLLLLALRVSAQPLPDRREISGRVASAKGVPIGGAQIQIKRKDAKANAVFWGIALLSNVAGDWSVPDAEDGDYIITVSAPGYESWTSAYTLREYEPSLRITLRRTVSLTFTLRDANGQPVHNKNAAIFAFITKPGVWQRGNQPGVPLGTTTRTDSKGDCKLTGSSEGVYHEIYINVRGVGYARLPSKVEILEGDTQHFDVQLQKSAASLRVKVVEESPNTKVAGRPLGAAQIYPLSVEPLREGDKTLALWLLRQNDHISNDGTGVIVFSDILAGRYQLRVTTPYNCNLAEFSEEVQSVNIKPDEAKEIEFRIPPCSAETPSLQITLTDERGMPLANRDVRLFCQPISEKSGMNLQIGEAKERRVPTSSSRRGTTDAAGRITLYPFWTGLWRVSAFELEARIPFRGFQAVNVKPEGSQVTISTKLAGDIEE